MHRLLSLLAATTLATTTIAVGACSERTAAATVRRPVHVDTILPRAEALRRFQATARSTDSLANGASSRDALVHAFVGALEKRDTTQLRRLALNRDEFAYLYYPTAPQGLPPYDVAPELLWFMLGNGSDKGIGRALASRGGQPLGYETYRCDPTPSPQGANTVWGPCIVRRRQGGRIVEERLFGLIVERAGHFKFVDYGNGL
jgi:hypothetical protein